MPIDNAVGGLRYQAKVTSKQIVIFKVMNVEVQLEIVTVGNGHKSTANSLSPISCFRYNRRDGRLEEKLPFFIV